MRPGDLVERTMATVRASAIAELRTLVHGQAERTLTSAQAIDIVDWVLGEASDALKDALDDAYPDGQTEQERWWADPYQDGRIEYFRGGITKDYPLPRVKRDGLE